MNIFIFIVRDKPSMIQLLDSYMDSSVICSEVEDKKRLRVKITKTPQFDMNSNYTCMNTCLHEPGTNRYIYLKCTSRYMNTKKD